MSFDRIAPFYRLMEFLSAGGKLQRCRVAFLDAIPVPQAILLAGEGHGRFLPECMRKFPNAQITVMDASERMLAISRRQVTGGNVCYELVDLLEWQPSHAAFDLIVTNFFLDCFTKDELPRVIEKLVCSGTSDASWLIADFQLAPAGLAKWRSRMILRLLYAFFRVVSGLRASELISPGALLEEQGFQRVAHQTFEWGLLKSEWWTAKSERKTFGTPAGP